MRRTLIVILAMLAVFLGGAIQVRQFVGALQTTGDKSRLLATEGDRLVWRAVESQRGRIRPRLPVTWHVGAPYVESSDGLYLARRQEPTGTVIVLSPQRNDDAKWAIEIVEKISPKHPERGSRDELRMLIGKAGARIRLSVFDGPRRGHYLALAKTDSNGDSAAAKQARFTLTADVREALVLEYIENEFDIDHR